MKAFIKGLPKEKNFIFDIGVPDADVLKLKHNIRFSEISGVNSLYNFFRYTLYRGKLLQDNMEKFPVIEEMGYFDYSAKYSWNDFRQNFIPEIVFSYELIPEVKPVIIILSPLSITQSLAFDDAELIKY